MAPPALAQIGADLFEQVTVDTTLQPQATYSATSCLELVHRARKPRR